MKRREKQLGKPRKRRADPDVAAVMAGNPIIAWRAGWSLILSVMSVALLVGLALGSIVKGSGEPAGRLAVCLGVYGFFWLAALAYGGGEGAEGSVENAEAYRGVFALRAAMLVLGMALIVWSDDGKLGLGEAAMSAGLWMSAFLESACVGRVARDHGFTIRKGVMVSFRVASLSGRQAFGVVEELQRDG